ncbi:UPF0481 protein At3g47200 [Populus alba]|uniref:Uncharacterized protein n=1 Tax=Populus alba TaxID=43335 RepID=A0A4U5QMA3_POPAL|nr:UPF0481 protein At3g47200-like [Populus alba]TKS09885.1 hypothetical protein D5086_0000089860 [Populus alba]
MTTEQCIVIPVELEESSKKCHRVPRIFRRNDLSSNEDCYNPLVVSIGPYHHNDPTHELAEMQSLKNEMLEQFVNKSGKPREVLKRDVAESANSARKCYDEGSTKDLDDNAFTEMMLLDGCFILQFIFCFLREPQNLKLSNRVLAYFVKRDLFLLENQLPYEVLTKLMSLGFGDAEGKKLMEDFMEEVRGLPRDKSRDKENGKGLDCRFWSWRPAPKMNNQPRQIPQPGEITQPRQIPQPVHLLDYFHNRFMGGRDQKNPFEMGDGQWSSYRYVMELKSVGIHFKPSKTDKYTDLQYESTMRGGTVTLPRIVIDDCTKSLLLNLLAHEACPGSAEGFWVTSYVYFMDSLIDHPEDVKELRKKGILLNALGSDQEVADLFNEISRFMVFDSNAYRNVKSRIEKHCKNVTKKWVAEWLHDHFSSPWTFLAFFGAIVALVLTFIQTYKTLYPDNQ